MHGFFLDALESDAGDETAGADRVATAVAAFAAGPWQPVTAAGAGDEYRAEPGGRWHGSALAVGGTLIHGSLVLAG